MTCTWMARARTHLPHGEGAHDVAVVGLVGLAQVFAGKNEAGGRRVKCHTLQILVDQNRSLQIGHATVVLSAK